MDYLDHFSGLLAGLKREGRYRHFARIERLAGQFPRARIKTETGASREVTVWCSNDYLGMGQHPLVLAAMQQALKERGAGAGGTRNISGTLDEHMRLEQALAHWHGKEAGLIFTSGYISNMAALSTLARQLPDCVVLSDEGNHASMIHGIRQSGREKRIFRHNDVAHLAELLADLPREQPKIIAFESVYSMDGDIAPIADFVALAKQHGALTYLDEVHAVGLYGPEGAGVAARDNIAQEIDVIEGTLGKAFGLVGGYIAAASPIIDLVRSFAAEFIFTTSLPPVIAAGAEASLGVIRKADAARALLHKNAEQLKAMLRAEGLPVLPSVSHIVPLLIGEAKCCKAVADALFHEHGLYAQPINYPTVPRGRERLRLTPTPFHSPADLETLTEALCLLWDHHRIPRQMAA